MNSNHLKLYIYLFPILTLINTQVHSSPHYQYCENRKGSPTNEMTCDTCRTLHEAHNRTLKDLFNSLQDKAKKELRRENLPFQFKEDLSLLANDDFPEPSQLELAEKTQEQLDKIISTRKESTSNNIDLVKEHHQSVEVYDIFLMDDLVNLLKAYIFCLPKRFAEIIDSGKGDLRLTQCTAHAKLKSTLSNEPITDHYQALLVYTIIYLTLIAMSEDPDNPKDNESDYFPTWLIKQAHATLFPQRNVTIKSLIIKTDPIELNFYSYSDFLSLQHRLHSLKLGKSSIRRVKLLDFPAELPNTTKLIDQIITSKSTSQTTAKTERYFAHFMGTTTVLEATSPEELIPIAFSNYGIIAHFREHKLVNRPVSLHKLFHASQQQSTICS